MKFLRTLLILGRVSNLPTVWTNVVVGWLIGGGLLNWQPVAWLIAGVSLLYWAGMTLNDAFDAEWDREHAPERPIPSGAISRSLTWSIGGAQLLAGIGLLLWKTDANGGIVVGLVITILAYDWIHKRWQGAVLLMGLCRALVYYLAWDAARAEMRLNATSPLIYLVGGGVLLYIAGLTLVARGERSKKGGESVGMSIALLLLLIPLVFPFLLAIYEPTMDFTLLTIFMGAVAAGVWIVSFRTLLEKGQTPQGIGFAIAGIALYDATMAILVDWNTGLFCLVCFALTLIAQRFIPAT